MPRVDAQAMFEVFNQGLQKHGAGKEVAENCARLLVENSLDGVYSHGVNRYPRLISYLDLGYVQPQNTPERVETFGALEVWDGHLGMGNTNAQICMARAIELARTNGIGCVALRNTNHWMRGGAYGLQAADAGCIGICWTNTKPNMPAWGAKDQRIGNNPLIICIPKEHGHVMVDAAMAQFSYGAIEGARMAGRSLPVPGGYDSDGSLTTKPAEIEKSGRVLPIGFWKGSGFALTLDLIAACLSKGDSTCRLGQKCEDEYGLSQIFIAIDVLHISPEYARWVEETITDLKASQPAEAGGEITYPGEKSYRTRLENQEKGIPVNDAVWQKVLNA